MNNTKLHMAWAIGVLAALLIGSLSVAWANLPAIPNIISIALGLSSLVLAIVAIIQAVHGGSTLHTSLGKIESASSKALEAMNAVKLTAENLDNRTNSLEKIPETMGHIKEKIDLLSSNNSPSYSEESKENTSNSEEFNANLFYKESTTGTNIAIYTALMSLEKNKSFDSIDIFGKIPYIAGIVNGCLVTLMASKIIELDYVSGKMLTRNLDKFPRDIIYDNFTESTKDTTLHHLKKEIDEYFDPADKNGAVTES